MIQTIGYVKTLSVSEYSKSENIDDLLQEQSPHIVWFCTKCDETNIEMTFDGKINPYKFVCEKCSTEHLVKWTLDTKSKELDKLLEEKTIEEDTN